MAKTKINDIIINKKKVEIINSDNVRQSKKAGRNFHKGRLFFGAALLLVFVILGIKTINFFSGVTVRVSLLKEVVDIDTNLRADSDNGDVIFETMEFDAKKTQTSAATGFDEVKTKASGQIIVYNAYSSQPQALIANTRFETPDGKIYRISKQIVVPGAKISSGKLTPSSVETTVYSDQPGEEFNVGLTDFTIPGFKGGPRYDKFYGRSKTEITGGFTGKAPKVSEKEFSSIKESLDAELKEQMMNKIRQEIPDEYVFYDNAVKIVFSGDEKPSDAAFNADSLNFTAERSGKIFSYLLPKKELSETLVKKYLGEEFRGKTVVNNLEQLEFKIIKEELAKNSLVFNIKGRAEFIWTLDEEELKKSLIASPDNLESVFAAHQAIGKAEIFFKPSWWKFFPKKAGRISIEYK